MLVKVHLFAPLDNIISMEDNADRLFVVDKGIVLCRLVCTKFMAFGVDAVNAFRFNMKRRFAATAFTHGTTFSLDVEQMMDALLHCSSMQGGTKDWYKLQQVLKYIRRLRMREIMRVLVNTFQMINATTSNYEDALRQLQKEFHWVPEAHVAIIQVLFKHRYKKHLMRPSKMMNQPSERHDIDSDLYIRFQDMCKLLTPFGLQELASKLVGDEKLDVSKVMRMSAVELHACGVPMGSAMDFVEHRSKLIISAGDNDQSTR